MSIVLTKREENRRARQAGIVGVACAAFLEHGYAATSMSTIAERLGGSKGTLWAHFPSKEALFAAVLDDATAAFKAALEDALKPGRDQQVTLAAFCERMLEKLASEPSIKLHRLIVGEGGRFPEIGRIFFDRGPRQVTERLARYLSDEMQAGRMRQADPIEAARHLIGLLQGPQQAVLWNVGGPLMGEERRAFAERATATFLRAYAASA